ncbi:MAG: two-component regulator propeller domain-containing protein [Saprospiraceae bacterium]
MRNVLIVCFLSFTINVFGQLNGKYTFRHIDQTEGLLHTTVKGIGQDARGFIWILSMNGLQRYDGSRFVNYPEIINQSSVSVIHDSELNVDTLLHQVWILKSDKMESLDLSDNRITKFNLPDYLHEETYRKPMLFTDEQQGQWFIGEDGMIQYETNTRKIRGSFFNTNPGQHNRNTFIIKDPISGNYWMEDYNHILIADTTTKRIYSSADMLPEHPLLAQIKNQYATSGAFRFLLMDSYHNLWISSWKQYLLRYNLDTHMLSTYSLQDIRKKQKADNKGDMTLLINAMYEDRQKNLWFATDYAGLLKYDREKDDFDFITSDEKISNGLRYNFSILSIFQDREDNIWLGTDRGISIFNPYRNYFQSVRHVDGVEASLPKYDINDIIETSEGEILIATWGGGISIYDQQWNFIRNIEFKGPADYNLIWSFVESDDGMIWVGTQHGYIHIYDPVKHTFSTLHPVETVNSTIVSMAKDHQGDILMGLYNGNVVIWNKKEQKFYGYNDTNIHTSPDGNTAWNIYVDMANRCWVCTDSGVKEFDIQNHTFKKTYQPPVIDPEKGFTVRGIDQFDDSTFVIGAIYGGIYFFNINTGIFSRLMMDEQLTNTSIYAIKKDREGDIWFTTNYGLYKIHPDSSRVTIFNIDHSIINAALGSSKFYALKDHRWVTTTPAEIICFNPEKIGKNHGDRLEVEICGINVFDTPVFIDSFLKTHKPIHLPYTKNFISIEFSVLDFTELRQTKYSYRLSDVDKKWNYSTTRQFADYTDLKPGEYVFEVKADNGNGPSRITSFSIIITPPWWGTIWFRLTVILAVGSFIYLILKKRIQLIRKESDLKNKIAETEMMALRSQMNPHFIFNCINSIDAMIQSNDKYRATVYLNKFAKLIRNVLDSSKQNKVPLSKDMETLQLYIDLELFRHQNKFMATVHADDELIQNDYKVPPLIIQPYVENAILHGLRQRNDHDGKLTITVTKENEHIVYVIEDNGVGRKAGSGESGRNGQGYGMQMSSDRIRLFNDEEIASVQITDLMSDGHSSGTRIRVQLKLQ